MAESSEASSPASQDAAIKRRKRVNEPAKASHTRTVAACDACRVSKTRCDAARPECSKCVKRGRPCVYPDKDPSSVYVSLYCLLSAMLTFVCRFESLGSKILSVMNQQGRVLQELTQNLRATPHGLIPHDDDPESMSRKDVLWTPITGSDKILEWVVFPANQPVSTLPRSAYVAKPNPYALGMCGLSSTCVA